MAITVSPVTNLQSFTVAITRLNQLADLFTTNTMTVDTSDSGSPVTGNVSLLVISRLMLWPL